MTFLLDVNVLIALIDAAHIHHDLAHDWFARQGARAWSTCPLTQNGVLRVVGHPQYPNGPGSPAAVAPLMMELCNHPGHAFWPDDMSLLDRTHVESERLLSSSQITDTFLLALAKSNGGKLATFDRRLVTSAVREGAASLHVIKS